MNRIFGLETEYGLYIEGVELAELTDEARKFTQSFPTLALWDYSDERPLRDVRGFKASGLTTNPDDDQVERRSYGRRPRSPGEDHADRILSNGARFYHDHGHPEYSTPECSSIKDLVVHDRAGELILLKTATAYEDEMKRKVSLYKNNTDFHGMSYGHHENYLIKRETLFETLVHGLLPFFVTRILFTGAGKVGVERRGSPQKTFFQLSQRAEFFDTIQSVDTLHRRPLVNTRDEPHANSERWRRLHVICGDANMSEFATALKVGTTRLVLEMLESGYGPPVELKDPVQAIKDLSWDEDWKWILKTADRKEISAIQIQRAYQLAASELFSGRDDETDWVLREWAAVLDDLEVDPWRLSDRVDWVAKRHMLESFIKTEKIDWSSNLDLLRSFDLEYHNIDREFGLFWPLEESGAIRRISQDDEIQLAISKPPQNTRASIRGFCLENFNVKAVNWGRLLIEHDSELISLNMRHIAGVELSGELSEISSATTPNDMLELIKQLEERDGGASNA
jgi:proteasome accessory factor A